MLDALNRPNDARVQWLDAPEEAAATPLARRVLLSDAARPLRFAITGGLAGLLQLALLELLVRRGWPDAAANAVAFLLAAQLNFALSAAFTWRDRRDGSPLWRRWLMFHGSIAAMAAVNQLVFLTLHTFLPPLVAAAAGIAVAALGNFMLGNRLVFRSSMARDAGDDVDDENAA